MTIGSMEPICTNFIARRFFHRVKNGCRLTAAMEFIDVSGLYNKNDRIAEELLCLLVFVWSRRSEAWQLQPVENVGYKREKIKHLNVATYGLPGSAMIGLLA